VAEKNKGDGSSEEHHRRVPFLIGGGANTLHLTRHGGKIIEGSRGFRLLPADRNHAQGN